MSALMYKNNQFKQRYRNQNQRYRSQYGDNIISKKCYLQFMIVFVYKFTRHRISLKYVIQARSLTDVQLIDCG